MSPFFFFFFGPYFSPVKASRFFFSLYSHSETRGSKPCWCSLRGSLESLSLRGGGREPQSCMGLHKSRLDSVCSMPILFSSLPCFSSALSYGHTSSQRELTVMNAAVSATQDSWPHNQELSPKLCFREAFPCPALFMFLHAPILDRNMSVACNIQATLSTQL